MSEPWSAIDAPAPFHLTRPPLPRFVLALLAALAFASGAWAQGAPETETALGESPSPAEQTEPAEPAPPEIIAAEDVADRASEVRGIVSRLEARAEATPEVETVADRLDEAKELWRREASSALLSLESETSSALVDEAARVWSIREDLLADWNAILRERASVLAEDIDQLDRQRESWERTREAERADELPEALRETIRRVLDELEAARTRVRERRDAILALQAAVLSEQQLVEGVLERVKAARERIRSNLAKRDSPPLWTLWVQAQPGAAGERMRAAWSAWVDASARYLRTRPDDLTVLALLLVALTAAIALLGKRATHWALENESFASAARVLGRPLSAALLVLLLVYPLLLPSAPLLVRWVAGVVVLIPALRLIAPLLEGPGRRAVYLLSGWYAADALRVLLSAAPLMERSLLLLEAAAAAAALLWLLRRRRLSELTAARPGTRALGIAARIALALMVVSLLSNLVGNRSLAAVLVEGTLLSTYFALLLGGSMRVLQDLWSVLLHTRAMRRLRAVRNHPALLQRRGETFAKWGLALLWLWGALDFFRLREPLWGYALSSLSATWSVGELEFSLGDAVAFALTLWLAFWLSRFVRFVLEEDVMARTELPRGVPYAVSSIVHYVILLFGFLVAVSAAGFDMSRFALIVGALGVGIGIGLQDVVNNFVSGFILLFERPVQPGDTVQVGDLLGEVRRIGMRSSTVRTWSGAEVIVPNSKLVSDNVTNWTLSDRMRRVEIAIGVAYGTDPERVLALLVELARAHPDVLDEPAPSALFQSHGNSSLDFELRAWTASPEWFVVRSELNVAINRALREAGIEIPFPQRDLHLRSVAAGAREALGRSSDE